LLDVDDTPAVRERAGRVAIRYAACDLIGREETEPDQELVAEIRVTTREQSARRG